ncbi:hypothetical protein ACFRJ1_32960 [Streptomyces sp. NPDC056773]|uniref:hypothetical protein n=1 Tax=unclassified Streptomyces TaxID=2593676 RepID=UPI0036C51FE9
MMSRISEAAQHSTIRRSETADAKNHFSGLLLWIPVSKAVCTGSAQYTEADLDLRAAAGTRVLLARYR